MLKIISNRSLVCVHKCLGEQLNAFKHVINKRQFLSEAYRCQEAWDKRLQAPILQNIRLDELFNDLETKFQKEGKASVIDIDLFANAVREDSHLDELEELLHKLRLSPNTTDTLDSTHHSVIRIFLAMGKYDNLLRILNDRLNYGIFPDDYCNGLLMDTFLKERKYADAARVSSFQMLQEDWSHPIVSHLALYSCYMFLKNPEAIWEDAPEEPEDSGEVIKVRVDYLRNPYFDDHFDLRDPKLLIGKTMASLGKMFPDAVGKTYQLVGWGLYQKWDKVTQLLQQLIKEKSKPVVYREGVKIFENHLKQLPQDGSTAELLKQFSQSVQQLDALGLISDEDFNEVIRKKVESAVNAHEKQVIDEQCQVYTKWEKLREKLLHQQIKILSKKQRLEKVEETKKSLLEREKVLFYFDNEEKWELIIEDKEKQIADKLKKKRKVSKTSKVDDDYIPPQVSSR